MANVPILTAVRPFLTNIAQQLVLHRVSNPHVYYVDANCMELARRAMARSRNRGRGNRVPPGCRLPPLTPDRCGGFRFVAPDQAPPPPPRENLEPESEHRDVDKRAVREKSVDLTRRYDGLVPVLLLHPSQNGRNFRWDTVRPRGHKWRPMQLHKQMSRSGCSGALLNRPPCLSAHDAPKLVSHSIALTSGVDDTPSYCEHREA